MTFTQYLAQPAVQEALTAGLDNVVDDAKLEKTMGEFMQSYMTDYMEQVTKAITKQIETAMDKAMKDLGKAIPAAMSIDNDKFAEAFQFNMDEEELQALMMSLMSTEESSYDNNLVKLGYATEDDPYSINIYPKDFQTKQNVINILDNYNKRMEKTDEDKVIVYTDLVGTLMSSLNEIVDLISYVLIAFVAISLVVSSIMIGIITYISVLERKKEIGILRSIGAAKRDISRVFNAETLIIGFSAGILAIIVTLILDFIASTIVYSLIEVENIAILPPVAGVILIAISMFLTFVAGLIPSGAAARKDPVEALRSE
jgi:ABC-type antimicrobial peptide transport system permease subunit